MVIGDHRTVPPIDLCFAGAVGIESVTLVLFPGILNKKIACAADCVNAYLRGITREKYNIIAKSEFGELQG